MTREMRLMLELQFRNPVIFQNLLISVDIKYSLKCSFPHTVQFHDLSLMIMFSSEIK